MKKIVKGEEVEKKLGLKGQVEARTHPAGGSLLSSQRGVVSKQELAAKQKGDLILADAEKEAQAIRGQAQRLLNEVRGETEKAKRKGYEEGRQQGLAELTEEILKARKLREKFFEQAEPEMIRLILAIAEKVIGKIAKEHKEAIASIVQQALEKSLGDRIVVKLNPEDFKRLKKEDVHFSDFLDRTKQVHFKADETIVAGGCVVETEVGTIDAQLETQLKAIRKALGV